MIFSGNETGFSSRDPGVLPTAYDTLDPRARARGKLTEEENREILRTGKRLGKLGARPWFLISGSFDSRPSSVEPSTEEQVRASLVSTYGVPGPTSRRVPINVLLDSPGGSLDSAYKTVLYLSRYARTLDVYVPRRAKSASTLLALGADRVFLSPFGELGPLDTQIPDPRNPTKTISALDCYQSVDYVRRFGFATMTDMLTDLVALTEGRIPLKEVLDISSKFGIGAITPMLGSVMALDFGGWGRSLRIGQRYAECLLTDKDPDTDRAARIAERLVYGYTHHPFPIDYKEARDIGLMAEKMLAPVYTATMDVIEACHGKTFVGFISERESKKRKPPKSPARGMPGEAPHDGVAPASSPLPKVEEPPASAEVHDDDDFFTVRGRAKGSA